MGFFFSYRLSSLQPCSCSVSLSCCCRCSVGASCMGSSYRTGFIAGTLTEVVWLRHDSFMIAYSVPLHKQDLPTAQTQRFAGKKVSLRRRQQADTPNHCSTWHNSIKILLWYASNCNALRAAIAGLSYCLQFLRLRSGSYCVLHATLFITSFVMLHYTSFVAIHLLQGMVYIANTQIKSHVATYLFASQRYNTHWVSFRFTTSFIHFSSVQSTRCL